MPAKDLVFLKTGAEVKQALGRRVAELEERLARRNVALDELLADRVRLRAYLVRQQGAMPLRQSSLREDLPSEDHQEIAELCRRVANIEGELGAAAADPGAPAGRAGVRVHPGAARQLRVLRAPDPPGRTRRRTGPGPHVGSREFVVHRGGRAGERGVRPSSPVQ